MKGEKSWTQQQYDRTYRRMRRGFAFEYLLDNLGVPNEIVKAADYSYQAATYRVHGWESDMRRKRFHAIKYRITSSGEYLPF